MKCWSDEDLPLCSPPHRGGTRPPPSPAPWRSCCRGRWAPWSSSCTMTVTTEILMMALVTMMQNTQTTTVKDTGLVTTARATRAITMTTTTTVTIRMAVIITMTMMMAIIIINTVMKQTATVTHHTPLVSTPTNWTTFWTSSISQVTPDRRGPAKGSGRNFSFLYIYITFNQWFIF